MHWSLASLSMAQFSPTAPFVWRYYDVTRSISPVLRQVARTSVAAGGAVKAFKTVQF
jgi:hypothetical protein